jgi:hypothetical protein
MPEAYAYGMVCALTVGGLWQILASYYGYNVSATHSISEWPCLQLLPATAHRPSIPASRVS